MGLAFPAWLDIDGLLSDWTQTYGLFSTSARTGRLHTLWDLDNSANALNITGRDSLGLALCLDWHK